jgi:type II secretory pathway pseudopilin PulG
MKIKHFAFTLSEVLLTMTIVGTIAALTIPTLHYKKIKKEYTAKLKSFYSRMDNAILDMEMDKGSFKDMTFPEDKYNWYITNVDPYMGHQMLNKDDKTIYYKDGSSLIITDRNGDSLNCIDVILDLNGKKVPNSLGYDRFIFDYCFNNGARYEIFGDTNTFFGARGQTDISDYEEYTSLNYQSTTREQMVDTCKNSPETCTRLLQIDQWEFKNDYPFKF